MDDARETPAGFFRRTWKLWAALVIAYALVAAALPPMDDEVYYWSWSKTPQLSYYDHPGMTAWLIWLSTQLFGDTILGMRFPACVCVAFTLAVIAFLSQRVTQSPPMASAGPILLGVTLTPLFTFGGILITPDAPLIACWSAYMLWMVLIQETLVMGLHVPESSKGVVFYERPRPSQSLRDVPPKSYWVWWIIGGVLLGLGGLSKYTMVLAVPAGFFSCVMSGLPWRRWFAGYLLHGVVAVTVASPILIYNAQHNFEPLLFQWRHAMHDEPATLITFVEFFGVQFLLFGTLPLYLIPWTARHFGHFSPRLRVCSAFYLVPLAFFLYKATRTELEGNWGLVAFLSVWPVAAAWYETVRASRRWRWLTAASFLAPAVAVIGLTAILVTPASLLPVQLDRLSKQHARWEMSQQLAAAIHARNEVIPTFTNTYQMTALLRFHGVDARQEGDSRPSHYTFPAQSVFDCDAAYFVSDADENPLVSISHNPTLIGTFPISVRGEIVKQYLLWRVDRRSVLAPHQ